MKIEYKSGLSKLKAWVTDSWSNRLTGLGTQEDKTTAGSFEPVTPIADLELSSLYAGDGIAAKAVNVVPREIYRKGFTVKSKDATGAAKVSTKAKDLDVRGVFQEASIWGRLYGGCVVWVGADDGQDPQNPLNVSGIRDVVFLDTFDRRNANPSRNDTDAASPKFGKPSIYTLTSPISGKLSFVHESRLIFFGGAHTEPQARKFLNGWDYSILQAVYDDLRSFRSNYKAAEHMMTDASQSVFKIKDLLGMIAGGQMDLLQARAILLEMTRSIARAVFLDAEEEDFQKVETSFSGVGDMLDRSANLVSASTEIPVTILMGQAPAGLNATGASDIRVFYDRIASDQELKAKPQVDRVLDLIRISLKIQEPVESAFPSLWQETPREIADREKVEADTMAVWVSNDVLTPEAVAVAEFSGPTRQRPRVDPPTNPSGPPLNPKSIPGAIPELPQKQVLGPPATIPTQEPGPTPGQAPGAIP